MKYKKQSAVAPAQLCSTALGQRIIYYKTTLSCVNEAPLTQETDIQHSGKVSSALYTAQESLNKSLFTAVEQKRIPQIARLITQGADIGALRDGLTVLHLAVMNQNIELITCLLMHGANPNTPGLYGNTSLHEAALNITKKKLKIVELLLVAGANPNIQNDLGQTPLHFHKKAAPEIFDELAHLLLKAGAQLHFIDIKGNEPLKNLSKERRDALLRFALFSRFERW